MNAPHTQGPKPLLTAQNIAKLLCVGIRTVWRMVSSNPHFPKPLRISRGVVRWREEDIQAFLQKQAG